MQSRRDRAVIASFSSDTSIDPCATFKGESGNWRIDQAAWGHPASPAQLVGPVSPPPPPPLLLLLPLLCVYSRTQRERKRGWKKGRASVGGQLFRGLLWINGDLLCADQKYRPTNLVYNSPRKRKCTRPKRSLTYAFVFQSFKFTFIKPVLFL